MVCSLFSLGSNDEKCVLNKALACSVEKLFSSKQSNGADSGNY